MTWGEWALTSKPLPIKSSLLKRKKRGSRVNPSKNETPLPKVTRGIGKSKFGRFDGGKLGPQRREKTEKHIVPTRRVKKESQKDVKNSNRRGSESLWDAVTT